MATRVTLSVTICLVSVLALASSIDLGEHLSFSKIFVECTNVTFKCQNDGKCIQDRYVCDGIRHCSDNSDEFKCRKNECDPRQFFSCESDGECISIHWRCDGQGDCVDHSDEKSCEETTTILPSACPSNEFKCAGGLCIPLHWRCDGHTDCPDGSDEQSCKADEIHKNPCQEFSCEDDEMNCIPRRWVCDGSKDCPNGYDEEECQPPQEGKRECKLSEGSFLCGDQKTCIGFNLLCNGYNDCPDSSDEGLNCNITCKNKTCDQGCVALPNNKEETCFCNDGFTMAADNKTCYDIDECQTYGTCSQKCSNSRGSYTCSCEEGYILDEENKKSCLAEDDSNVPILYFSAKTEIKSLNLRNHNITLVSNDNRWVKEAIGVSFDGFENRIYWSNVQPGHQSIVSSKLDGSDAKIVANGSFKMPEDVVIDTLGRNFYYTDSGKKLVGVCSIAGGYCNHLITKNLDQPRGLALFPSEGLMFFSDWGRKPQISKSGMDGTGHTPIITHDIKWPNGITIDVTLKRIFWSDANYDRLESAKLDGSDRRPVLEHVIRHPFSLAVFEDTLYWSDWNGKEIQSCNKFDGSQHETIIKDSEGVPMGIHIFHPLLEPFSKSPCYWHPCSHICVLAQGGKKHACKCPEQMILNSDNRTCNNTIIANTSEGPKESVTVKTTDVHLKSSTRTTIETSTTEPTKSIKEDFYHQDNIIVGDDIIEDESRYSRLRVSNPLAIIIGICVGITLFIMVFVVVCFCYKSRRAVKDGHLRFLNPAFGLPGIIKGSTNKNCSDLNGVEVVSRGINNGGKETVCSKEEGLRYTNKPDPSSNGRLEFVNCSWSQPKLDAEGSTSTPMVIPSHAAMRRAITSPEMSGLKGSPNYLGDDDTDSDDGVKSDVTEELQSNWDSDKRHLLK